MLDGESYRFREAKERTNRKKPARRKQTTAAKPTAPFKCYFGVEFIKFRNYSPPSSVWGRRLARRKAGLQGLATAVLPAVIGVLVVWGSRIFAPTSCGGVNSYKVS